MSQRRVRAIPLSENAYGTAYPAPAERVVDTTNLSGGLNLWDLSYRMSIRQSPDCVNVFWKDGSLSSRPGQAYIYDPTAEGATDYGVFMACYERTWHGYIIAQKSTNLYKIDPATGAHTLLLSGLAQLSGGTFFIFGASLYYMNGNDYVQIDFDPNEYTMSAHFVVGYIPTVLNGVTPSGIGGGTYQPENRLSAGKTLLYTQTKHPDEVKIFKLPNGYYPLDGNPPIVKVLELSSMMDVSYTEVYEAATWDLFPSTGYAGVMYHATDPNKWYHWYGSGYAQDTGPANPADYSETVQIDPRASLPAVGEADKLYHRNSDNTWWAWNGSSYDQVYSPLAFTFEVRRESGEIEFNVKPEQLATPIVDNVSITIFKTNKEAYDSIVKCTCVTVFGNQTNLAVVCGGPPAQPNAYFWSGNNSTKLDPTYFPFDYYNFAGSNAEEYITGFGKQQNMLVIFKERSIGRSYFDIETLADGRDYLRLYYKPINDTIGCNLEKSIKLIENNLLFANTYGGVYVLADTSAAGENNVIRISRNVNGDDKRGLLKDLRAVSSPAVTSYDDSQRYWLCADGHVYLWDYSLSNYRASEEKQCWFYFESINTLGWYRLVNSAFADENGYADQFYFMPNGAIVAFTENVFSDFGGSIYRKFVFATQNFNTYEVLKDVLKVVFAVRSDTDSSMTITYRTDYEQRDDLTPIHTLSWRLCPRNLARRCLRPLPYAYTAVRTPRCFHIKHFSMTLENNEPYTDMSIVSAQIFYRYVRKDR